MTGKERDELVEALRVRMERDRTYADPDIRPMPIPNMTRPKTLDEMQDSRPGTEGHKVPIKRSLFTGGDIQALLYVLLLIGGVYVASLFLRIIVRLI